MRRNLQTVLDAVNDVITGHDLGIVHPYLHITGAEVRR
jgi:hypothetical protein